MSIYFLSFSVWVLVVLVFMGILPLFSYGGFKNLESLSFDCGFSEDCFEVNVFSNLLESYVFYFLLLEIDFLFIFIFIINPNHFSLFIIILGFMDLFYILNYVLKV